MPFRFRRRHAAILLAAAPAASLLAWSPLSNAAPRRAKPTSRSGNVLRRVAPKARKVLSPRLLARRVMSQTFQAQVLSPGTADAPPPVEREFRAAWVATVFNLDWPSKPGLSAAAQQSEIRSILDNAKSLNLNALIWQVRPMSDSFYRSRLEPWSRFLSGTGGRDPGYDPLAYIVTEAHKRGIEIHAWFNPYRVASSSQTSFPAGHIARTRPELVVRYGKWLWLDPGKREVQEHTKRVVLDVVKRYDIDGVHLDDYFYPYVEKDARGANVPFPDDATYGKYLRDGGRLTKGDWRRSGVNTLVKGLHEGIKREKSWVKFGISPFGIWRPGNPSSVRGLDAYQVLYADSRRWLREGWVDYFTPQLYWAISAPEQGYRELLGWWAGQNVKDRHLWPGQNIGNVGGKWGAGEITNQIAATRAQDGASGNVLFSARVLWRNPGNIAGALKSTYATQALVPASPWMDARAPVAPTVAGRVDAASKTLQVEWRALGEPVSQWTVQMRFPRADGSAAWTTQIVPGSWLGATLALTEGQMPDRVAVCAVDRVGNQSAPVGAVLK